MTFIEEDDDEEFEENLEGEEEEEEVTYADNGESLVVQRSLSVDQKDEDE